VEGRSPRGGRVTTRTIGSERFLFLGGAIETISQGDPRSRRSLASLVALVLAAGFLAFFGDEARAQQSPQQQHAAVAHEDPLVAAVEEASRLAAGATPAEVLLSETPLPEMLSASAEAAPSGLVSPAKKPPDGQVRADPTPVMFDRRAAGKSPVGTAPVWGMLGDTGATQASGPLLGLEAVPTAATWPGALEKNDLPPLPREQRPTANTPVPGAHRVPLSGSEAAGAVPAGPAPSTAVRGTPVPLVPGSPAVGYQPPPRPEIAVSSVAANLQSGAANAANITDTLPSAPATDGGPSPAPSSSGSGDASEGSPQQEWPPPSPLAPLWGSSFSLSGGQAGPGGGLTPLLVCVLASGLVLLRRDGLLFRLAPYEPPKPSSALLLPLERPG
jgi:type II secretory pathway component PulM